MRAATATAGLDGVQTSCSIGAVCPDRRVQVATYTTSLTTVSFNFTSFDGSGAHLVYSWNLGITPNGAEVVVQQVKSKTFLDREQKP